MKEFLYGKTYVVERTEASVTAFEVMVREKGSLSVYVRTYVPGTNELKSIAVCLSIFNDGIEEFVTYQDLIKASDCYEGELCIYTKEGLKNYDEQTNQKNYRFNNTNRAFSSLEALMKMLVVIPAVQLLLIDFDEFSYKQTLKNGGQQK